MGETRFRAGDLVKLRSGGPRMVVSRVDPSGLVAAAWFSWDFPVRRGLCEELFAPETLQIVL